MYHEIDEPFAGIDPPPSAINPLFIVRLRGSPWGKLGWRLWCMVRSPWPYRILFVGGLFIVLLDLQFRDYLRAIGSSWRFLF
jgi:hypothetical protein